MTRLHRLEKERPHKTLRIKQLTHFIDRYVINLKWFCYKKHFIAVIFTVDDVAKFYLYFIFFSDDCRLHLIPVFTPDNCTDT